MSWKPKPTEAERLQTLETEVANAIRHGAIDCGLIHDSEIATAIGMNYRTFQDKMKSGRWTHKELCRAVKALKLPPEKVLRMMGAET